MTVLDFPLTKMQWISFFNINKCKNKKTSPCYRRAPNLLNVLPSRMVGWNELCSPALRLLRQLKHRILQRNLSLFVFYSSIIYTFKATVTLRIKWPWPPQNFCIAISMWNNSWVKLSRKFSSRSGLQNNQVLGEVKIIHQSGIKKIFFWEAECSF